MTACNNNVRGGKASRVITAALVATLSVGTPMAAIASTVSEGGVDMLVSDKSNVANAKVTYNAANGTAFEYDGSGKGLIPVSMTLDDETTTVSQFELLPVNRANRVTGNYYYWYVDFSNTSDQTSQYGLKYKDENGDYIGLSCGNYMSDGEYAEPTEVGKYAVVVGKYTGAGFDCVSEAATFSITAQDLQKAALFDTTDGADNVEDKTFNFSLEKDAMKLSELKKSIGVEIDGEVVNAENYDLTFYSGNKPLTDNDVLTVNENYTVQIAGKNAFDGKSAWVTYKVSPLDLSTLNIEGVVSTTKPTAAPTLNSIVSKINGVDVAQLNSTALDMIKVTFKSDPNGAPVFSDSTYGKYVYTLSDTVTDGKGSGYFTSATNTATYYYTSSKADIEFNQDESAGTLTVDLSDTDGPRYDASKISVKTASGDKINKYSVTYTNDEGKTVSEADLAKPGTYYVTVSVDTTVKGTYVAGSETLKVVVSYGAATQDANVFMTFDGKNVESTVSPMYTGENLADKISILAKKGDVKFVEGTDYKVKITNASNKEVSEIVDAGKYTVTVTPVTFTLSGGQPAKFYIDVQQMTIDEIAVVNDLVSDSTTGDGYLLYTGDELTPSYTFTSYGEDKKANTDDDVTFELPADYFTIKYTQGSSTSSVKLKAVGDYTATLSLTKKAGNYKLGSTSVAASVKVTDKGIFADVANNEWFSSTVYQASKLGYMTGYKGTSFFGPHDTITRGQAAIVLYNMATAGSTNDGDPVVGTEPDITDEGYVTGFSDVDPSMYYAKAIAWAKSCGIVSGYGDTGLFGPDDAVTREQFAIMLANYAKLTGKYEAVDAEKALASYADADQVSDYAKWAVAWAADQEIMGNGSDLFAGSSIERAAVATMVVRYQPTHLDGGLA